MLNRHIIVAVATVMFCQRALSAETFINDRPDDAQVFIKHLGLLLTNYVRRTDIRYKSIVVVKSELDIQSLDQRRAFEKGYIMGEIIESYRRAVVYTDKQLAKKRHLENNRLRFLMYVQNAYMKVFHLVHMMHEINAKYGTDNTGQITRSNLNTLMHKINPTYWNTTGFYYTEDLEAMRNNLVQERQNKMNREKKIRKWELEVNKKVSWASIKQTTNWWPQAYGWDIDYYW